MRAARRRPVPRQACRWQTALASPPPIAACCWTTTTTTQRTLRPEGARVSLSGHPAWRHPLRSPIWRPPWPPPTLLCIRCSRLRYRRLRRIGAGTRVSGARPPPRWPSGPLTRMRCGRRGGWPCTAPRCQIRTRQTAAGGLALAAAALAGRQLSWRRRTWMPRLRRGGVWSAGVLTAWQLGAGQTGAGLCSWRAGAETGQPGVAATAEARGRAAAGSGAPSGTPSGAGRATRWTCWAIWAAGAAR
jgi:hypothetical protein